MSEHTPGPWNLLDTLGAWSSRLVVMSQHVDDAIVASIGDDLPGTEANARLIAAAPDLLAAALKAQCACSIKERDSGHLVDCWMPEMLAAIAKAEPR